MYNIPAKLDIEFITEPVFFSINSNKKMKLSESLLGKSSKKEAKKLDSRFVRCCKPGECC